MTRDHILNIRADDEFRYNVEKLEKILNMNRSEVLRLALRDAMERYGKITHPNDVIHIQRNDLQNFMSVALDQNFELIRGLIPEIVKNTVEKLKEG